MTSFGILVCTPSAMSRALWTVSKENGSPATVKFTKTSSQYAVRWIRIEVFLLYFRVKICMFPSFVEAYLSSFM